jgi:hypothetical protein
MLLLCAPLTAQTDDRWYEPADTDILTRGPVHEAFAEPISLDPGPGALAPVAPPDPIDEVPPDHRPRGDYIDWIPGYWMWDDEFNDFIWISGIWRNIPPGREWIAGYWIRSSGGFRWIPGFWAKAEREHVLYLPEPPVSVETGPDYRSAPSPDYIWVSGTWIWHNDRYAWRPGSWVRGRPDWIWTPAHHVWSPRGYVFVEGYWDYDVNRRGVLFAPVRFEKRVYTRSRVRYSPRTVIDINLISDHLFLRVNSYHYYFGDYYEERYAARGYRPWFKADPGRKVCDPIYIHNRWRHRDDRDWDKRLRIQFDLRLRESSRRPARTWAAHRGDGVKRDHGDRERSGGRTVIARSLTDYVGRSKHAGGFERIDDDRRKRLAQHTESVQRTRSLRLKFEGREGDKPDHRYEKRTRPARARDYETDISSKSKPKRDDVHKAPERPKQPKVDDTVKPRRRTKDDRKSDDGRRDDRKKDDDKNKDRARRGGTKKKKD